MDARVEELICKVADGCATPEERQELERMAANDPTIADELHEQQDTVNAIRSLGLRELQDEVRDQFWGGVYNRLEQRCGWAFVIAGIVAVAGYGIYEMLTDPTIHSLYRLGIAAIIVGFGLLISSVLRVRLKVRRYDKYREVIR